jgi:hypothetical protein
MGAGANLEALRQSDVPAGELAPIESGVDARTNYVGRIRVTFSDEAPSETRLARITDLITEDRITSVTRQLEWDHAQGVLALNSPRAQGATGFLSARGTIELADAALNIKAEFASVLLVPLDGGSIATSGKLLLQVSTEQQPFGWQTEGDAVKTITSIGGPPLMLRDVEGSVALKRSDARQLRVTRIAPNGAREGDPTPDASTISLRPGVLYYLIER